MTGTDNVGDRFAAKAIAMAKQQRVGGLRMLDANPARRRGEGISLEWAVPEAIPEHGPLGVVARFREWPNQPVGRARMPIPIPRSVVVTLLGLAVAACAAAPNAPAGVIRAKFTCDGGRAIAAEFVNAPQPLVRLALSDGRALTLPQAISASGARYASVDDRVVFWNKGDTAFVEEGDKATFTGCVVER